MRDKGIITLGNKFTNPPKNVHYSTLQELLALQRGFPHGLAEGDTHDDYNPLYNKLLLAQTQCRVCLKWYPSQKCMLLHGRALHPRSRVNKLADIAVHDNQEDVDQLLLNSEKRFYDNIDKITDSRDGQYLALMKDGSRSWIELSDDNKLVIEYLASLPPPDTQVNLEQMYDVNAWNLCPFIPDDT